MSAPSRYRRFVQSLSWPALILLCAAILGALFLTGMAYWWCARNLAWWTFSLAFAGGCLISPTLIGVRKARS